MSDVRMLGGRGSTQPLPNITNPYQSKTCLDKAPRALKKFVVGWWVVCLIIVSTPGPVLTRNGTKQWLDHVRTRQGPGPGAVVDSFCSSQLAVYRGFQLIREPLFAHWYLLVHPLLLDLLSNAQR